MPRKEQVGRGNRWKEDWENEIKGKREEGGKEEG